MIKVEWPCSLPDEVIDRAVQAASQVYEIEFEPPRQAASGPPMLGGSEATEMLRYTLLGDAEQHGSLWVARDGFRTVLLFDRLPRQVDFAGGLMALLTSEAAVGAHYHIYGTAVVEPTRRSWWRRWLWPF